GQSSAHSPWRAGRREGARYHPPGEHLLARSALQRGRLLLRRAAETRGSAVCPRPSRCRRHSASFLALGEGLHRREDARGEVTPVLERRSVRTRSPRLCRAVVVVPCDQGRTAGGGVDADDFQAPTLSAIRYLLSPIRRAPVADSCG